MLYMKLLSTFQMLCLFGGLSFSCAVLESFTTWRPARGCALESLNISLCAFYGALLIKLCCSLRASLVGHCKVILSFSSVLIVPDLIKVDLMLKSAEHLKVCAVWDGCSANGW
jgi:hypothetical protein